jgi:hypothetical protein
MIKIITIITFRKWSFLHCFSVAIPRLKTSLFIYNNNNDSLINLETHQFTTWNKLYLALSTEKLDFIIFQSNLLLFRQMPDRRLTDLYLLNLGIPNENTRVIILENIVLIKYEIFFWMLDFNKYTSTWKTIVVIQGKVNLYFLNVIIQCIKHN